MLRYLLDTNLCIDVIKRRPQELLDTFNRHASQMAISAITFSELLHGLEKSAAPARNLAAVEDFCSRLICWPMALRHPCITGKSGPPWSAAGRPSASTTSISPPTPAVRA